ncbi:midasin-like isoform X2 [Tigriopus californicus]|uniref:midasin-like isoform X2 n=1 Tax=Tigriopus californicus TaxID=6832 RepID=UPI0027DA09D1|nr:midasin-like isoform X2 [Tigriopus californicus]
MLMDRVVQMWSMHLGHCLWLVFHVVPPFPGPTLALALHAVSYPLITQRNRWHILTHNTSGTTSFVFAFAFAHSEMVRTYYQNNASSLGGTFGGGGDEPKYGRRASSKRVSQPTYQYSRLTFSPAPFSTLCASWLLCFFWALLFQSEFAVSDLDSLSSPSLRSFTKRAPHELSNQRLSNTNYGPEKYQNTSVLCCDHCTLKAHSPRPSFGNPGTTLEPFVPRSVPGTISPGNVFILPTIPQYQVAPSGLSLGGLNLGLCQGCHHVYGQNQKKNGQHGSMDFEIQARTNNMRSDPGGSNGIKSSTSDGHLSRNNRSHSLPHNSYDDFDMRMGLTELTGTLQRLQNVTDDNIMDESDYSGGGHYLPEPGTSTPLELDEFARKSWSAPQDNGFNGSGDIFKGQNNLESSRGQSQHSVTNHHRYQQQPPPEPPTQNNRRRGQGPPSKSAYRRELEQQMKEQQVRKDHENKQIRAEKFGMDQDPMDHLHGRNGTTKSDRSGGYSPSLIEGQQRRARRGGNEPPPAQSGGSRADMVMQMAEERARRERDKKDDGRDWWEKRKEPDHFGESPTKPHPAQRARQQPKQDRMSYEDELKAQIEDRKRRDEEEKRKEREEDEKLERRLREQQEKMNAEIQEEKARKRQKEEANAKRQEEMSRKKREMEAQVERARKEAADLKFKEKKAAAKLANQAAREQTPSPEPTEEFVPFRSDSPPIPAMRGKAGLPPSGAPNDDSEAIANQLSTMRQQLDRQQEEHDSVWNGLVEV